MKIIKLKTLNEAVEEITDKTYSVIDHNLASAKKQEVESKEKAAEIIDKKIEEFPIEDRDAHTKVDATPALKKMMLAESLFTEWLSSDKDSLNIELVYKELGSKITADDVKNSIEFIEEYIDKNKKGIFTNMDLLAAGFDLFSDLGDSQEGVKAAKEYQAKAPKNHRLIVDTIGKLKDHDKIPADIDKLDILKQLLAYMKNKSSVNESLFTEYVDDEDDDSEDMDASWMEDIIDILKMASAEDVKDDDFLKDLKELYFKHFPHPEELDESISGNTSHAQDFVSALRSAGFGDGFDQKLKIDTYGNGGTRIEFKDQSGHFIVTITDDKVVLEGQDEGEEPFEKEFTTWEEFASEFESLYPGIPVRENKILVEEKEIVLDEASYTRSDDKKMLVKQKREPLVDVIQMALTDGEWGYVKSPDGTVTPSLLPHLSYPIDEVGVTFDKDGRYFVRAWDVSEEALQKVAEVAKQFDREYKIGFDKFVSGDKKWYCLIYLDEDTDFDDPYVDPEAEVNYEGIKGRGTKLRGNPEARHTRDNEDLEDSQRYPIESPQPAQTGLLNEDVSVNGSLMEDKISTDMIHDFKPQEGVAEETFNRILEAGKMETFEFMLEDRFPQGVTTEELNRVLSDEAQWVYDQLGMKEFLIPEEDEEE